MLSNLIITLHDKDSLMRTFFFFHSLSIRSATVSIIIIIGVVVVGIYYKNYKLWDKSKGLIISSLNELWCWNFFSLEGN